MSIKQLNDFRRDFSTTVSKLAVVVDRYDGLRARVRAQSARRALLAMPITATQANDLIQEIKEIETRCIVVGHCFTVLSSHLRGLENDPLVRYAASVEYESIVNVVRFAVEFVDRYHDWIGSGSPLVVFVHSDNTATNLGNMEMPSQLDLLALTRLLEFPQEFTPITSSAPAASPQTN